MIKVCCPLCRKKSFKILFDKEGFNIVQCLNCQLIFVNPRLKHSQTNANYSKEYYKRPSRKSRQTHQGYDDYNKRYLHGKERMRSKLILDKISFYKKPPGKLVDVGAATGFFLKDALVRGWQAEGVEISNWAVNYARHHLKLKMTLGELKTAKFDNSSFDVVTMNDFLEHVQDPLEELKEAKRVLKKEGILYVETLNFDGFINTKLIGQKYHLIAPKFHLTYFGRHQLLQMLKKAGFRVCSVELTSSSVGDFEYEGLRMYLRYFQLIILSILGLRKNKIWAFKDIIKIIAQKQGKSV